MEAVTPPRRRKTDVEAVFLLRLPAELADHLQATTDQHPGHVVTLVPGPAISGPFKSTPSVHRLSFLLGMGMGAALVAAALAIGVGAVPFHLP